MIYQDDGTCAISVNDTRIYLSKYDNLLNVEGIALDGIYMYSASDIINIDNIKSNGCDKCYNAKECVEDWNI